jgi:hypothetical protein
MPNRRAAGPRGRLPVGLLVGLLVATPAHAQYPNAYVLARGVLRVSFEPDYNSARERFAADGDLQPLGADFSDTAAGARLFPTLLPGEAAVRAILNDSTYRMNVGALTTTRDADVRHFPLNLALGLSSRITLTASIPIVTSRSQVNVRLDSGAANVGWNQAIGEPGAATQIAVLLTGIESGAAYVESRIAAGDYGCPVSPECDGARAAVARARALGPTLAQLTGVGPDGTVGASPTPFAPLAGSSTGLALLAEVQAVSDTLQGLGAAAIGVTIPLPAARLTGEDLDALVSTEGLGYDAEPLAFTKYKEKLGDLELGLRIGLLQAPSARVVLVGGARLPTAMRDSPDHYLDIGTGDRQMDVIAGLETALESRAVGLSLRGSYTLQLADDLPLRVAPHTSPIAPSSTRAEVHRDLGDVLEVGVFPTLRLTDALGVYGAASYRRKSADAYTYPSGGAAPTAPDGSPIDPSVLAFESALEQVAFGAGIAYRAVSDRRGPTLPVEAGIDYQAVFWGSGGQVFKTTRLGFYLRLFYRVFGGGAADRRTDGPADR